MSLVQHVSSIYGVDREPELQDEITEQGSALSHMAPIGRNLSYDPLPQPPLPPVEVTAVPPYKVSAARRVAQVIVTVLACWLASGIVFGFAALKPVLIEEGVYRSLCTDEELRDGEDVCHEQDLKLNMFFTIGSITANVSALPVGAMLDRYGSRICGFAGCASLVAGCLLMAYTSSVAQFDGYIIGNFFLALGGTFIFVPSFQIANAFPKYAGTIVALVTGAFDASAAVYLFYRLLYEGSHRTLSLHKFFLIYLLVPAFILISNLTIMQPSDYQNQYHLEMKIEKAGDPTRDVHDSDDEIESEAERRRVRNERASRRRDRMRKLDEVLGDETERQQREHQEEERHMTSGVWGALHGLSARRQMVTPWFVLMTLLTVLQMLRMNYFIATIRTQYEYMLGSDHLADRINRFFDVALPAGGVLSTPFIGLLLDRLSVPGILACIVALTTAIGVLNSVPAMWTGYLTVVLFVLVRPLYYSAMSDYATKVFGFATFGRVYGTIICVSGLVNFSQYGLDSLTHGPFAGDPMPINIFFATAGFVIGTALVVYVVVAGKKLKAQELALAQNEEWRRLIPEEDEYED